MLAISIYHIPLSLSPPVAPLVSAITPPSTAVPVGKQIQLLVEYRGGFPDPEITWSHHNGINNVTVSENNRTEQHGLFGINLTISDVSVSDKGTYTLEVSNCGGTVVLEFNVTVLGQCTLAGLMQRV